MRDIILAKAMLNDRREKAEKDYADVLELLRSDKEFDEDYSRHSYLEFELARREVYGLEAGELKTERDKLKEKLAKCFEKNGMVGLGKPAYTCQKCSDTGYYGGKRCNCLEKARIEVNLDRFPALKDLPATAAEIDYGFYGGNNKAYEKCAEFLRDNFVNGDLNFCTIIGAPGTAKTYFAECCIKEMLLKGASITIINGVKLNRLFLEYHCAPLEKKASVWSELECDVLLVDDLGVEAVLNNVTVQYLYELLTERAEKKTLITSNLDLHALEEKYGQRILSRLADKRRSAVVPFGGSDYRLK